MRAARAHHRPLSGTARRRGRPAAGVRGDGALGGADVRRTGKARIRNAPGALLVLAGHRRRRRSRRRAARRPGRAGRGAGSADRVRGTGRRAVRDHVRAGLAHRAAGRPPGAGAVPGQFPGAGDRRRPRRDPGHSRRKNLSPAGGRLDEPAAADPSRARRVRPDRIRRPRARHRIRRAAVVGGFQRRVPPGGPPARGDRRDAVAAGAPGIGASRRPAGGAGPWWAAVGAGARRARVHRARGRRSVRAAGGAGADRPRLRPRRPAPHQAGPALGAGGRPCPAQLRVTAHGRARHRGGLCPRGVQRRSDRLHETSGDAARAGVAASA